MKTFIDRLNNGELVAFPTETVYGLGAPIFNESAVAKIFQTKGRPSDNPLIAHIADLSQVEQIAVDIPDDFYRLAHVFFPGPLTIVLKKHPAVPLIVSGGLETIALRMPRHPLALELIRGVGQPLVAPSANLSGKPSSTTAAHVRADFEGKIGAILDGGATEYGLESTVISLVSDPCLLRQGTISRQEMEAVLGKSIREASPKDQLSSPGTRYRHYAPQATVKLFTDRLAFENYSSPCRFLACDGIQASDLYARLRQADDENYEEIVIYCTPVMLQNLALMDRLQRAVTHNGQV